MEGLTLRGEQKGYVIGRVLVEGAGEKGRERDLGLTCKINFFLIKKGKKTLNNDIKKRLNSKNRRKKRIKESVKKKCFPQPGVGGSCL